MVFLSGSRTAAASTSCLKLTSPMISLLKQLWKKLFQRTAGLQKLPHFTVVKEALSPSTKWVPSSQPNPGTGIPEGKPLALSSVFWALLRSSRPYRGFCGSMLPHSSADPNFAELAQRCGIVASDPPCVLQNLHSIPGPILGDTHEILLPLIFFHMVRRRW
jgi:hypothetical protein